MDPRLIAEHFQLDETPSLAPRYNIAPTQRVPAIRVIVDDGRRRMEMLRWGLIPSWARDASIGNRLINARAETVHAKPSFREAYRSRRCLVVADGFYEWKKLGRLKQPYLIRLASGEPFGIGGLWERWRAPDGAPVESCTLITVPANKLVAELHDRMPVIIDPRDYDRWLDPASGGATLKEMLRPCPSDLLVATPVSSRVNDPNNDDPALVMPD
jgi:putative SOS response-associated peptidase YedK